MRAYELLVLGVGNVLCADDGVGVVALHRLAASHRPPRECRLVDGGTRGLGLLPYIEKAHAAIILDAIRLPNVESGSVVRLDGESLTQSLRQRLSAHEAGLGDLLDGARLRGKLPRDLVLIGVVPETLDLKVGLSRKVDAALAQLQESVLRETARFGCPLTPLRRPRRLSHLLGSPAARVFSDA